MLDLGRKVVAQTYITTTGGIWLNVGSNALHGVNLVYVRGWLVDDKYPVVELVLLNTKTRVETVLVTEEGGYLDTPSISPDGQQVAYTAGDGIYVISPGKGEPRRVVETCSMWDDWPPAPSWSPDSQWLVYHRCTCPCPVQTDIGDYSIFKVNVETGEEILLVEEGLNPYWRLGPGVADGS
jgi:Tol biopolymer transport system component